MNLLSENQKNNTRQDGDSTTTHQKRLTETQSAISERLQSTVPTARESLLKAAHEHGMSGEEAVQFVDELSGGRTFVTGAELSQAHRGLSTKMINDLYACVRILLHTHFDHCSDDDDEE